MIKTGDIASLLPRKKISIAVVGLPSSGKSYLLNDIIMTLDEIGFKPEAESLPLDFPYNSFGGYFNDVYAPSAGMIQTSEYACRQENHYGAHLIHEHTGQKIAVDFLNIPGETLLVSGNQSSSYNTLTETIQRNINNKVLDVTTWVNPYGGKKLLIEPKETLSESTMLPTRQKMLEQSEASLPNPTNRVSNYQSWEDIYKELRNGKYTLDKSRTINGKELLDHFFQFDTDSIFASLVSTWELFAPELELADYLSALHDLKDFYYLHYAAKATDIIVCDRLYSQENKSQEKGQFPELINLLCSLMEAKHSPHTYMAFRGTDLLMNRDSSYYSKFAELSIKEKRKQAYEDFLSNQLTDPQQRKEIKALVGDDLSSGFQRLLFYSGTISHAIAFGQPSGKVANEYVFFTATPIDSEFHFYDNDNKDETRFRHRLTSIHQGEPYYRSYIRSVAIKEIQPLCFGTYQLMEALLTNDGILKSKEN